MKTSCSQASMGPFCKFYLCYYHYYAVILDMQLQPSRGYVFFKKFTNINSITRIRNLVVPNFLLFLQLKIIIATDSQLTSLTTYSFHIFFKL